MGPAGTKIAGRWPKVAAAMTRPGTILSQTPRKSAASKQLCESATPAASAITSRLKSESSMPGWPWVTPSHIAGTPPATWAVPPASPGRVADQRGIALERLVGREHVVVGGDDADVAGGAFGLARLVGVRAGGEGVGEVAAGEVRPRRPGVRRLVMRSR